MTAYLVVRMEITDFEPYREYMKHTPRVIAQYGGRFVARGGTVETLEGPAEARRMVILGFPSADHARAFYASPEYAAVKRLREDVSRAEVILIEGYDEADWPAILAASQALTPPGA